MRLSRRLLNLVAPMFFGLVPGLVPGIAFSAHHTSRRVTGEEAYRWGLANELVPQDQVRAAAMKLAMKRAR